MEFCFPEFIIASLAAVSWAVPSDQFADRCTITLTLLLTLVAGHFTALGLLPPLPHFTIMHYYHYGAVGFVSLLVIMNMMVSGVRVVFFFHDH